MRSALERWTSSRSYLAVSIVFALIAGMAAHASLRGGADAGGGGAVLVVVAAGPVARGSVIGAGDVRLATVPRAYAQPGSFSRIAQVVGRVALADLAAGETVTQTRLARVRAGPVASLIPEGLRAFAVPTSLPPGAVVAGDHVDVLATYGGGRPHTEVVATAVEVLLVLRAGTGQARSPAASLGGGAVAAVGGGSNGPALVLLVSPDQEADLAYARAFADVQVVVAPAGG